MSSTKNGDIDYTGQNNGLSRVLSEAEKAFNDGSEYNSQDVIREPTEDELLLMVAKDIVRFPLGTMLKLGQQLAKHNKPSSENPDTAVVNMMMMYEWAKELTEKSNKNET